jgi:hypothetical protein
MDAEECLKRNARMSEMGTEVRRKKNGAEDAGLKRSFPVNKTKIPILPASSWRESILVSFRRDPLYQSLSMMLFLPYLDNIGQMAPWVTHVNKTGLPQL